MLFIRTDRLGETLLNLPAMAALKAALPQASLTLLANPQLEPLLRDVPWIDRILPYQPDPTAWWLIEAVRLAGRLRRERFDLAIVSNPTKVFHVAVWLAGIPQRVGYDRKWGGLLTRRIPDDKALGESHEVEYNLQLIRALGLPFADPPWRLPRFEREESDIAQLLARQGVGAGDRVVAVHPWTSNPRKAWPIERYQQLIRLAGERPGIRTVLIGGPEATGRAEAAIPSGAPVVNLTGRLTLRQLAAFLARAAVLVSNDSGPVHVAAAVGTPTIVLFGTSEPGTGPRRWGPWGPGHRVIWKPSMDAIGIEEVRDALQPFLESHPKTPR